MKIIPFIFMFSVAVPGMAEIWHPRGYERALPEWGPQRNEVMHAPFRMPLLKDSNPSRLKRLYLRHRMTVNPEGLVIGHQATNLADAERYLQMSGAGEQSANVHTIKKNKEGWHKGSKIAFMVEMSVILTRVALEVHNKAHPNAKVPVPPAALDGVFLAQPGPGAVNAVAQTELNRALAKPAEDFNLRLAAALGLKDRADVDCDAVASLPPPLEDLDLADLGPGEDWKEFLGDYRISCRGGNWHVGEGRFRGGEISAWLSQMGYDRAAEVMGEGGRLTTKTMHRLAEVNSRLAAHLEIRARTANPALFPQSDGGPILPAHGRKDGPASPREMMDQ